MTIPTEAPQSIDIKPVPKPVAVETFFRTMPNYSPDRDRVFKVKAKAAFFDDPVNIYEKTAGNIVAKRSDDGNEEVEYFILMDPKEFKTIYKDEETVIVRDIGRPVKFIPMVENVYYTKPELPQINQLGIDDSLLLFLNPETVTWVNPSELPKYDPALDTTNQTVSQG